MAPKSGALHTSRPMNFRALALAASAAAVPLTAAAQQPLNLDFERAAVNGSGGAWGWSLGWSAFQGGSIATFLRDSAVVHGGRYSLRITVPDSEVAPTIQTILLQVPSGFAIGHRLQLSGWLRAGSGVPPPHLLLTLEAWKNGEFAAADTARVAGPDIGSPERWQRVVLDIKVPDDATIHSIVIGASLDGTGSAWFDDLSLSVDGRRITTLPVDPPPPSGRDLAWLASRSAPLFPDSGLAAFDSLVGSATIVGLGESTHGTHEFFETKARLVEHLVRTQGVRVFVIEANQLAAERINRFVAGGEGSAPDVMKVLFRVWNTEEVLQLVARAQEGNRTRRRRRAYLGGWRRMDRDRNAPVPAGILQDPCLLRVERCQQVGSCRQRDQRQKRGIESLEHRTDAQLPRLPGAPLEPPSGPPARARAWS